MRKILIILILLFILSGSCFPQEWRHIVKQNIPKSPEAAAFDRVTDVPVNMYTGRADFSIPLYTVTSGDISLPISLDYEGTAIRVEQEATWVGLNWLLNAGGCINVNSVAGHSAKSRDFIEKDEYGQSWSHLFNEMNLTPVYPDGGEFRIPYKINGLQPGRGEYGLNWFPGSDFDPGDMSRGLYDEILNYHNAERPIYHAVFMGNCLTFVWDPFKQEFFQTGLRKNFKITGTPGSCIDITDGKGVRYEFNLLEKVFPIGNNADMDHLTYDGTFYLTGIVSPTGHAITLQYYDEAGYFPARHVSEKLYDKEFPVKILLDSYSGKIFDPTTATTDVIPTVTSNNLSLVRAISPYYCIKKCRLASINADDVSVIFHADKPRMDLNYGPYDNNHSGKVNRLDEIEVTKKEADGTRTILRRFALDYSYFGKNETGGNTLSDYWHDMATDVDIYNQFYSNDDFMYLRLRLDKLTEYGSDGNAKPPYRFGYNGIALPGKNSASQDYWGYYNGKENRNGLASYKDDYNSKKRYHTLLPKRFSSDDIWHDSLSSLEAYLQIHGADRRSNYRYSNAGMLTSVQYPTGGEVHFTYRQNTFNNHYYESADTAESIPGYFSKKVTVYTPVRTRTLTVTTNNKECFEPVTQRWHNSMDFTLDSMSSVSLVAEYRNSHTGHLDKLIGYKVHLYKILRISESQATDSVVSDIQLQYSNSLSGKSSITLAKDLTLSSGEYRLFIDPLQQDSIEPEYKAITCTLSSEKELAYKNRQEVPVNHHSEPTLGRTTSVSFKAVSGISVYECNNPNYSAPGVAHGSTYFLVEKPSHVNFSVSYSMSSSGKKRVHWKNFFSRPAILLRYDIITSGNQHVESVCGSKAISLQPQDTLDISASKSVSIRLQPGRYQLMIPKLNSDYSEGAFYEISAQVSLDSRYKDPKISYGNGLCVASVTRADGSNRYGTCYDYSGNTENITSGTLSAPMVFGQKRTLVYQQSPDAGGDIQPDIPAKEIVYGFVSNQDQNANSSQVRYTHVTKTSTDNGRLLAKRNVAFWNRNWADGNMWYDIPVPDDPRNGLVVADSTSDSKGNALASASYEYRIDSVKSRMLNARVDNLYYGPVSPAKDHINYWALLTNGGIMNICAYANAQFAMTKVKETASTILKNGAVRQTRLTEFNCDNCQPLRETVSTLNGNEQIVREYRYPCDFTGNDTLSQLNASFINAVPVESSEFVLNQNGSALCGSTVIKYNVHGQPTGYYTKDISGAVSKDSFVPVNKNGFDLSGYTRRLSVAYDDSTHNPVTLTDQGGLRTELAWGYHNLYPVSVTAGGLTTRYEYDPHVGMTRMTETNGNAESYAYDGFQRLATVSGIDGITHRYRYSYHYGQNYIRQVQPLDASGLAKATSIQYYDGLGRPTLSASDGISGNGNSVLALRTYDGLDRTVREYLPAVSDGGTGYISDKDFSAILRSTYNDSHAYSETSYDALNRPAYTQTAGDAWHSAKKGIRKEYITNMKDDVKMYKAPMDGTNHMVKSGYYPPCTLIGEKTTDEDGHVITVYTDMLGQKVLEHKESDEGSNDTYFVYNDLGQLRFVLSPEYQNHAKKAIFGYEYRYDSRGNIVKKILPQCGYVQYWYDKADRLIYMQDGRMRTQGLYRFYLYDDLSRIVVEGICAGCNRGESVTHATFGASGTGFLGTGYTMDHNLNLVSPKLEKVNYYDDYSFLNLPVFKDNAALKKSAGPSSPVCAKGFSTGTITATNRGELLPGILYYNIKGEVIESHRALPDNALLVTKNTYSFTGNIDSTRQILYKGAGCPYTTLIVNKYNPHNDKLCSEDMAIDGTAAQNISSITYDDLGRIRNLSHGSNDGPTRYTYNLHGWATDIVNKDFEEHLTYNTGSQGNAYYNGNISTQQWRAGNERVLRDYIFTYDKLDRLTRALYVEGESFEDNMDKYTEQIPEYSANGAVKKIIRYGLKQDGKYGKVDNLDITLNGNQLSRVDDDALPVLRKGATDFFDNKVKTNGTEYLYDENGALIQDANRGITKIEYDQRDNPTLIQFSDGSQTEYVYTSAGEKLRTIHRTASPNITVALGEKKSLSKDEALETDSTDYIGNFIFENGRPDKYLFNGGYYTYAAPSNGSTRYHYYITDHLGNNRVVVNGNGAIEQTVHYYPFGDVYADAGFNPSFQKYKYNGKELDLTHGLNTYDYGARQYDPVLARWDKVDPLAEKFPNLTAYNYTANNPICFIDPDGKEMEMPLPQWLRYAKFVIKYPIATYQIGKGVTHDADNISTNSTRFATRGNILDGTRPKVEREHGSENGAFRHTLWQAAITSTFDAKIATEAGNAHEMNPNTNLSIRSFINLSDADQTVDLLNNQIGREIGQRNKGKNMNYLAFRVLYEFKNKGLYTATKKSGKWVVERTQLSEGKYLSLYKIFKGLDNRGFTPKEARMHDNKEKQKLQSQQITWGTMK